MSLNTRNLANSIGAEYGNAIPAPAPQSDVQTQLTHMEDSISRLDAVVLNVLSRLAPVLRPSAPREIGKCADGPPVAATDLAMQISALASRVDSVRGALADAHERLGI